MSLATLTNMGRAAIVKAISERPLHLAWGTGDPIWDEASPIPSLLDATSLVAEIGRRAPTFVAFVESDKTGEIVIPQGLTPQGSVLETRYKQVPYPTPNLYMRIIFDYEDTPTAVIREMGIFMDTAFKEGLPPGQRYFESSEIEAPGMLLTAQIINPPINCSPSVRKTVEFVLSI